MTNISLPTSNDFMHYLVRGIYYIWFDYYFVIDKDDMLKEYHQRLKDSDD